MWNLLHRAALTGAHHVLNALAYLVMKASHHMVRLFGFLADAAETCRERAAQ